MFFWSREMIHADESPLLSVTVRRFLLDRIEATVYSWTVYGDPTNVGMHAHFAAFPYLDVTKISIRQPCLNFTIFSSHTLPHRLCRLDVLLPTCNEFYSNDNIKWGGKKHDNEPFNDIHGVSGARYTYSQAVSRTKEQLPAVFVRLPLYFTGFELHYTTATGYSMIFMTHHEAPDEC